MSDGKEHLKPIGARLMEIRKQLHFANREAFAEAFGVPKKTFEKYEQGISELPTKLMQWLHEVHKVNLTWLLTGIGDPFNEPPEVDPWIMDRLYVTVEKTYRELGRPISGNGIAREATELLNQLRDHLKDPRNRKLVEGILPTLGANLKDRLIAAEPGSGKASA